MYDLAIVGSGIASSTTLCRLADCLDRLPKPNEILRICVIEKDRELWKGIPYGSRSVVGALAFQKLDEFLQEPERSHYIDWLKRNADSWLSTLIEVGGAGAVRWIEDNRALMDRDKWGELYLPRFLFGVYISSEAEHAVDRLSRSDRAKVTRIHGEAIDVSRSPSTYSHSITVEDAVGLRITVQATNLVLAIGSPPQKAICSGAVSSQHGHTHLENLYCPSEELSLAKITQTLSSVTKRTMANILIVGSNASALEVLYLINYRSELKTLINSVVVLSHSGQLPYKICEAKVRFKLRALDSLRELSDFSAAELMAAITCDIRRAEEAKLNIADLRDPVGAAVGHLTALMNIREQERFVCEYGMQFSKMMRRAGRDTRTAADKLAESGILTTVRGEFLRLEPWPSGNGQMAAVYAVPGSQVEVTHPVPFCITINCGGFEGLVPSSSPLINSLIANGICKVNSTNRGFLVNERLEASANAYVIGPLVGGNFNEKVRYWHVESASRISGLARLLADSLCEALYPEDRPSLQGTEELVGGSQEPLSSIPIAL